MFAPIGYRTYEQIEWLMRDAASAKWPFSNNCAKKSKTGQVDWQEDTTVMNFLYFYWLRNRFFSYGLTDVYLASADGLVLRVSNSIFESTEAGQKFYDALSGREPTYESFATYQDLVDTFGFTSLPQFRFFDPESGLIRIDDTKQKSDNSEPDLTASAVKKFHGWSVCFKEEDFPQTSADLRTLEDINFEDGKSVSGGGRPPLAQKAASAYLARYPNGHGAKTWSEVEDEIDFKSKTVRNGLAQMGWKKPE